MRDFLHKDLDLELASAEVGAVVTVQSQQSLEHNEFLFNQASAAPWIAGIVGWVDLCSSEVEAQLDAHLSDPVFKGVRHLLSLETDDRFMLRPEFVRGIEGLTVRGLTFDLLILPHHLPFARELALRLPEQRFVLDHMGNPPVGEAAKMTTWGKDLRSLAACPNVSCKVSGFLTLGAVGPALDARAEDIGSAIRHALDVFGPDRSMWGSDWPVCLTVGAYDGSLTLLESVLATHRPGARQAVLSETAARVYCLDVSIV
jgi:L-fuconolactonase